MQKKLFRKVSLERLSSPEQLDQLMTITNRRGWIGLLGVLGLLSVLILWSLFGVVTTKIDAKGIMIRGDGVYQVNAIHQGVITELKVNSGDRVKKGDLIAYMASPDLAEQIQQLEAKRLEITKANIVEDEELINEQIAALQESSEKQYAVVSPFNGQVMQVKASQGSFLMPGKSILDMERNSETGKDLQAVIFLPVHQAKILSPGMKVELCPDGVSREKFGFMVGRVGSVSQYPVSNEELLRLIGNEDMVKRITNQQILTELRVELIPNESKAGTYQWSSGAGPDSGINSRDLCTASIISKHQRPLDLFLLW